MSGSANHVFLPSVQPGVAANIPDQAVERFFPDQPAVMSLPVRLEVNREVVEKTLRLYGPGDIIGIDPQQVVRLEPRDGTTDFEPNYFPAIEFDRPDFPWLFTPAKADAQGQLRPWLCLVVVRRQPGVEFRSAAGQPLPVLEIKGPASPAEELPDLSESHFWAHAQLTGADRIDLTTTLSDPARTVSRLLCPRRLDPATEYLACVVPTFEVGRKAALGQANESTATLEPAWLSGSQAPVEITLPVYYSWGFRTGAAGDFEALVRRLEPRQLPAEVGKRPMDLTQPGFTIEPPPAPGAPGTTLGLEGALRVVDTQADEWPDDVRLPFQSALADILDTPWKLATQQNTGGDPIVAPPIYGCWQAAIHQMGKTDRIPPPPIWLDELNLDPRHRAVAAMGTRVVQEQQEQLMASAWQQLGDIEKINQRLRQAQLSRAVNERYYRTFSRFSEDAFVKIVAPAQSRVVLDEQSFGGQAVGTLLAQKLAGSFVPPTAVSAPLRKIARPRGAINRQFSKAQVSGVQMSFRAFDTAGAGLHAGPSLWNRGVVTIDAVSGAIPIQMVEVRDHRDNTVSYAPFVWNPDPPPGHWERPTASLLQMIEKFRLGQLVSQAATWAQAPQPPITAEFVDAARVHHEYLTRLFTAGSVAEFRVAVSAGDLKAAVLLSLTPARTVSKAVLDGAEFRSPGLLTGDELDPIMDAPTFPQPMYEGLRDLSQDYLFPGLEHVPPNTIQVLQTNAKFIESFMVGLNAEMSRELLWRGYPTDQRGTYFQHFWDKDPEAEGELPAADIAPIHEWRDRTLGTTAVAAGGDKLVLLIRGEILRRYPGTVIFAVKAVLHDGKRALATDHPDQATPPLEAYPLFRGTLEPDVSFIGFDLTPEEAVADNGWFFVLQQQPTEPRFGLDADPFGAGGDGKIPELKTWRDLNWAHLAPNPDQLKQLAYVSVSRSPLIPTAPVKGRWGRNAAHMAYITKQLPARVAIHAADLLR